MTDVLSVGTTLSYGESPTLVGYITSLGGPDGDTVDVPTSDYDIDDGYQTFMAGMSDAGEVTATVKFDKAAFAAVYAQVGVLQDWSITLADGSKLNFEGYLKSPSFEFADAAEDGLVTNSLTIKVSGKPAFVGAT